MTTLQAIEIIELSDIITTEELLQAFAQLIKDKTVWNLQGYYGRQAMYLINEGIITKEGKITKKAYELTCY